MTLKNPAHAATAADALQTLYMHFGQNKRQMAKGLGVTEAVVHYYFRRGYVGKAIAKVIDDRKDIPITKEQLRPDISSWDFKYKFFNN